MTPDEFVNDYLTFVSRKWREAFEDDVQRLQKEATQNGETVEVVVPKFPFQFWKIDETVRAHTTWLNQYATGAWSRVAFHGIIFANHRDAVLFKLTWC